MQIVDDNRDRRGLREITKEMNDPVEETCLRLGMTLAVAVAAELGQQRVKLGPTRLEKGLKRRRSQDVEPDPVRTHGLRFERAAAQDESSRLSHAAREVFDQTRLPDPRLPREEHHVIRRAILDV